MMQIGISSHRVRRWSLLALVALLGIAVTFATTSVGNASGGHAVAAKKKCKKKGKKSAAVAKKKCKKKKKSPAPAPVAQPTPPPTGPVVRADVSWTVTGVTDEADIDVHAWHAGAHTGYSEVSVGGEDLEIPNLIWEPGFEFGRERILDNTNPSTRGLTFAICSYGFPGTTLDPAEVTYHFVFASGSVLDGVQTMNPGDLLGIDPKEGGFITDPREEWCPELV
jgi:hypothetical protein